jgi:probable phosphoglycerate mutase
MKEIYLIRHGQTDYNKQGVVQGSGIDSDLNEVGLQQAQAFYEAYQDIAFDKIYISKLKRTYQTIAPFLDKNIPIEKHEGLNEISWGKKEGRPILPEEDAYYYFMLSEWQRGIVDLAIEGGESPLQVYARQKPILDIILSRPEEEKILICMHGRAMRIFLCLLLNYEIKDMERFEHANVCLYKLTYTGSMFTIDRYFDIEHLRELNEA